MNKDFMYGVGKVSINGADVGYIKKESFDINGQKGEVAKVEAEQVPGASVLIIPQSNGTIAPKFILIHLKYENIKQLSGGTVHYAKTDTEKKTPIGWTPQSELLLLSGYVQIDLVSGQSILIPKAVLMSNLAGKLTLKETAEVDCAMEIEQPSEGKPYGIFDTSSLPAKWVSDHIVPKDESIELTAKG